MKVLRLVAENVKRLHAIDITPNPDEALVQITGLNEQGKTSLLDCIKWAVDGKRGITEDPIHHGQDEARIQLEIGDGPLFETEDYVITRVFDDNGTDVVVKNRDGRVFKSPQALLDKLKGDLTFDPLEFARAKPRDQREMLLRVVKLTLNDSRFKAITGSLPDNEIDCLANVELAYKKLFDERTGVGRLRDQAEKVAKEYSDVIPAKTESASSLMAEKDRLAAINTENARKRDDVLGLSQRWGDKKRRREELVAEIARLQEQADQLQTDMDEIKEKGLALKAETDKLEDQDLTGILQRIASIDENNRQSVRYQERLKAEQKLAEYADDYETYTARLDGINALKVDMLKDTVFPVDGLGFGTDYVTFVNEAGEPVPFTQAAESQRWIVSAGIAMALNPTLRVVRIDDASLLDSKHLETLRQLAKGRDYQVWTESVDETGQVGIVIHDGRVVAEN